MPKETKYCIARCNEGIIVRPTSGQTRCGGYFIGTVPPDHRDNLMCGFITGWDSDNPRTVEEVRDYIAELPPGSLQFKGIYIGIAMLESSDCAVDFNVPVQID